ncbi:hypothetical protein BOTBODRAFT_515820 [Botryobasidium botryosum FD-172 SS1]|uniref:Uncharacterized protein n=1 Tax=Botryobasidium botryosum (strain FD-172 SS1) TaxID=930990 RepID=A0A067N474_BOTB1|nr:hypothetical protein BOTBODRAFT_515820 [Botryobasidium botryosum FD-172 SS1]
MSRHGGAGWSLASTRTAVRAVGAVGRGRWWCEMGRRGASPIITGNRMLFTAVVHVWPTLPAETKTRPHTSCFVHPASSVAIILSWQVRHRRQQDQAFGARRAVLELQIRREIWGASSGYRTSYGSINIPTLPILPNSTSVGNAAGPPTDSEIFLFVAAQRHSGPFVFYAGW